MSLSRVEAAMLVKAANKALPVIDTDVGIVFTGMDEELPEVAHFDLAIPMSFIEEHIKSRPGSGNYDLISQIRDALLEEIMDAFDFGDEVDEGDFIYVENSDTEQIYLVRVHSVDTEYIHGYIVNAPEESKDVIYTFNRDRFTISYAGLDTEPQL